MRERRAGACARPRTTRLRAHTTALEPDEFNRGKKKHPLKLALFALAAVLAGAVTFAGRPAAPASERLQGLASIEVIDDFLSDSRRYLGL